MHSSSTCTDYIKNPVIVCTSKAALVEFDPYVLGNKIAYGKFMTAEQQQTTFVLKYLLDRLAQII